MILLIARNPGGLLLDSCVLMGLGGVVAYFVGMLWLGGKIADRACSLEPTAMNASRVGKDGAFGGGGSFGTLVVSVFKDYARRLENITNVSYIVMVLIMMKAFVAPQYEVGPGDPPVPLMMSLMLLPIITVMVTGDVTVQGREIIYIYKKSPNAIGRFHKAMVLKSWLVVVPIAAGTSLLTSPLQPGTTLAEALVTTGLMAVFSSANAVFVTGLFLVNPAFFDRSPQAIPQRVHRPVRGHRHVRSVALHRHPGHEAPGPDLRSNWGLPHPFGVQSDNWIRGAARGEEKAPRDGVRTLRLKVQVFYPQEAMVSPCPTNSSAK